MHKVEIILILKQQQTFVKYGTCFTKTQINYISIGCSVVCFLHLCSCATAFQKFSTVAVAATKTVVILQGSNRVQ